MNETDAPESRGYTLGRDARVVVHRSRRGYSVALVHSEGPFSHEQAKALAAKVRREGSGHLTKAEAAEMLGLSEKGVDYLRGAGHLVTVSAPDSRVRVLIDADSVREYKEKRDGR